MTKQTLKSLLKKIIKTTSVKKELQKPLITHHKIIMLNKMNVSLKIKYILKAIIKNFCNTKEKDLTVLKKVNFKLYHKEMNN